MKQYCAEHFGSKHALRSPPHITLHMPFKWKERRLEELQQALAHAVAGFEAFDLELKDFDFFPPRVVFVDVAANQPLRELQRRVARHLRSLQLFNADHKDQGFHPHVTIAFRDLKKPRFEQAKAYYETQNYEAQFLVDQVVLLKHNGKTWDTSECFPFDSPANGV